MAAMFDPIYVTKVMNELYERYGLGIEAVITPKDKASPPPKEGVESA